MLLRQLCDLRIGLADFFVGAGLEFFLEEGVFHHGDDPGVDGVVCHHVDFRFRKLFLADLQDLFIVLNQVRHPGWFVVSVGRYVSAGIGIAGSRRAVHIVGADVDKEPGRLQIQQHGVDVTQKFIGGVAPDPPVVDQQAVFRQVAFCVELSYREVLHQGGTGKEDLAFFYVLVEVLEVL